MKPRKTRRKTMSPEHKAELNAELAKAVDWTGTCRFCDTIVTGKMADVLAHKEVCRGRPNPQ